MIRRAFQWLSPGGERGRLWILIFHRVLAHPDPLFPEEMHAARFDALCRWLGHCFNVLPLDEGALRLQERSLPPRAAAISFDDGYADNYEIALPILHRHGLPATFFIATGFLDGGCMWNDIVIDAVRHCRTEQVDLEIGLPGRHAIVDTAQRRSLIDRLLPAIKHMVPEARLAAAQHIASRCQAPAPVAPMLSTIQLQALAAAGMHVGAHTVNHPILTAIAPSLARNEISRSKARLEEVLDRKITLFAYPNGRPILDYGPEHVTMARDLGFEAAVSTKSDVSSISSCIFELERYTPWGTSMMTLAGRALISHARSNKKLMSRGL